MNPHLLTQEVKQLKKKIGLLRKFFCVKLEFLKLESLVLTLDL